MARPGKLTPLGERIDARRAELGHGLADVYRACQISRAALNRIRLALSREREGPPEAEYIRRAELYAAGQLRELPRPEQAERVLAPPGLSYPVELACGVAYREPVEVSDRCPCALEVACRASVNADGLALCEGILEADLIPRLTTAAR